MPRGGCQGRLTGEQQVLPKGMVNEVWSCYFGMHPEPNATVQEGLLGEFDVGAAVEQKRELRGFSFGVSEKFKGCKSHNKWASHSHINGDFLLSLPDFPFLYLPLLPLWTCCIYPLDTQGHFFPLLPPGLSYFKPWHYIYTPVPSHLLNICPFLFGVCLAAPPACTGWLIPPSSLCHTVRLWDSITGCPMSRCACGGSQAADISS